MKLKTGAVNYLNTRPLIYGFAHGEMQQEVDLTMDYPANVAAQLLDGRIQLGLVPVAVLPQLPYYQIVGNYCIGCDGPVASVCLFSTVPLEEIHTVLLDYQSRTSVALVKLLFREYWKREVVFEAAEGDFTERVTGSTAALVIGDRAFVMAQQVQYVYDLGEAWKAHTGLPFVFAVWAANVPVDADFAERFNRACSVGFNHLPEIIAASQPVPGQADLHKYYTRHIQYHFGKEQEKAMRIFLQKLENED